MLAVVHAMCIYQILGFFVSTNPEQARSAELQHLFFLKVCQSQLQKRPLRAVRSGGKQMAN